jgi:hypothetical protein
MATPKYLLGRLLTGAAGEEELVAKMGPDYEYLEPDVPVTIGTILEAYGLDKEAEVAEALDVAKKRELGDIERKLAAWLAAAEKQKAREKARGVMGLYQLEKGPKGIGLPSDLAADVASYITKKKGPLERQMGELKKVAEGTGGRRKTRKSKKTLRRKTKKSRRSYK